MPRRAWPSSRSPWCCSAAGQRRGARADRSIGYDVGVSYHLVLPAAQAVAVSGAGTLRVPGASALREIRLSGSGDIWISALTAMDLTAAKAP